MTSPASSPESGLFPVGGSDVLVVAVVGDICTAVGVIAAAGMADPVDETVGVGVSAVVTSAERTERHRLGHE